MGVANLFQWELDIEFDNKDLIKNDKDDDGDEQNEPAAIVATRPRPHCPHE